MLADTRVRYLSGSDTEHDLVYCFHYVIFPDIHYTSWCEQFFARFFFDCFPVLEWSWHQLSIITFAILKHIFNPIRKILINQVSCNSAMSMRTSSLMVTWELFYNSHIEFSFGQCKTGTDSICTSTKNWILRDPSHFLDHSFSTGS